MTEQERQDTIGGILKRFYSGVESSMGEGREDHREALHRAYDNSSVDYQANRVDMMLGTNRTLTASRDMLNMSDPAARQAREQMGLGFSDDPVVRRGQQLGHIGSDIVQDRSRELWWLINAAQALGNVGQDILLKDIAQNLYKKDDLYLTPSREVTTEESVDNLPIKTKNQAIDAGIAYLDGDKLRTKKDVSVGPDGQYRRNRHRKGHVDMLNIPVGVVINSGIGLMNPFGGQEGYKAVFESDDDPTVSSNPLAEVGAKYILGRTGNLLPWDEFKKVRPDVSKDEYMRYKAFKFDKEGDFNPLDDGQMTLPTGILKYTNDGIHGAEVQFLGRSLPVATTVAPAIATAYGTAYGARRGGVRGGLLGGLGTAALSMTGGNLIEGERRRRNAAENEQDRIN